MRIDKYLKISRIIKRRTIAKDVLDLGFVKINGKVAKPSTEVSANDILELALGERKLVVRVTNLQKVVTKNESSSLFEIIEDSKI